jgi:hypothetical protein
VILFTTPLRKACNAFTTILREAQAAGKYNFIVLERNISRKTLLPFFCRCIHKWRTTTVQQPRFKPTTRLLPPLRTIQATDNEIIILLAALQHYPLCGCHQKELAEAIPLIQAFIQRLHSQLPPREGQ